MRDLFALRNEDLGELAPVLRPFIDAYRPHSRPPSRQELLAAKLEVLPKESCMDVVREQWEGQQEWADDWRTQ